MPRSFRCWWSLGLGKFAQLLGGSGQGAPFDGAWAVAFAPPGPWVSPLPGVPAHPSQMYEGLWLLAALPVAVLWLASRRALVARRAGDQAVAVDRGGGLFLGLPAVVPARAGRCRLQLARRSADRPAQC